MSNANSFDTSSVETSNEGSVVGNILNKAASPLVAVGNRPLQTCLGFLVLAFFVHAVSGNIDFENFLTPRTNDVPASVK